MNVTPAVLMCCIKFIYKVQLYECSEKREKKNSQK